MRGNPPGSRFALRPYVGGWSLYRQRQGIRTTPAEAILILGSTLIGSEVNLRA